MLVGVLAYVAFPFTAQPRPSSHADGLVEAEQKATGSKSSGGGSSSSSNSYNYNYHYRGTYICSTTDCDGATATIFFKHPHRSI